MTLRTTPDGSWLAHLRAGDEMRTVAYKWTARSITLDFSFSALPLFTKRFAALTLDNLFTQFGPDPEDPPPPFEKFCHGIDVLLLRSCPVGAPLPRLAWRPRCLRYVPAQYQRSFIDLEGSFPDYLKKFSSKLRWTLLRKVKRYAKHSGGEIRWRTYRDPTEMVEFHRLARKVSKRSYQELLGAGLPDGDEFQAQLRALAAQNRAREFILFSGDRPVAYMFCEISKGIVLSNYVGYDPEFQRWSPGTVLLYLALEHLFAEGGYLAFDFGEGGRQHKEIYSTHSIFCADIYLFRRSARTVPVVLLHAAWVQIVASAARFLNRFCRLTKLRRLLRMRARRSEEL